MVAGDALTTALVTQDALPGDVSGAAAARAGAERAAARLPWVAPTCALIGFAAGLVVFKRRRLSADSSIRPGKRGRT